ncbi:MAG: hypothetical protein WC650_02665 [Candidatus Doudnabacteria bacterium]
MTTNELKVLSIIWDWGGEASVDIIAREAGISIDYARILGESLNREGCIDFLHSKLCKIKSKGKLAIASKNGQNFYPPKFSEGKLRRVRKIVIPERPSKFGLGKDKRGRFILNYG